MLQRLVRVEEQVLVCVSKFLIDFNVEPSVLLSWEAHGGAMLLSIETVCRNDKLHEV